MEYLLWEKTVLSNILFPLKRFFLPHVLKKKKKTIAYMEIIKQGGNSLP